MQSSILVIIFVKLKSAMQDSGSAQRENLMMFVAGREGRLRVCAHVSVHFLSKPY